MVVLTYPANVTAESNLIRIKSDILVYSDWKVCVDTIPAHTQMHRCFLMSILLFCSVWVMFAWETILTRPSIDFFLTHTNYSFNIWPKLWTVPLTWFGGKATNKPQEYWRNIETELQRYAYFDKLCTLHKLFSDLVILFTTFYHSSVWSNVQLAYLCTTRQNFVFKILEVNLIYYYFFGEMPL